MCFVYGLTYQVSSIRNVTSLTTSPPILWATNTIFSCRSAESVGKGHILVFFQVQKQLECKFVRKIIDVIDSFRLPNRHIAWVIAKGHNAHIFHAVDFRQPERPKGIRCIRGPCPSRRASQPMNENDIYRRVGQRIRWTRFTLGVQTKSTGMLNL